MELLKLVAGNLRTRWRERFGKKTDANYLHELRATWTADVIRPQRANGQDSIRPLRNLTLVRSDRRTVLSKVA